MHKKAYVSDLSRYLSVYIIQVFVLKIYFSFIVISQSSYLDIFLLEKKNQNEYVTEKIIMSIYINGNRY